MVYLSEDGFGLEGEYACQIGPNESELFLKVLAMHLASVTMCPFMSKPVGFDFILPIRHSFKQFHNNLGDICFT